MEVVIALIANILVYVFVFNVFLLFLQIWIVCWVVYKIIRGIIYLITQLINYIRERRA